MQFVVFCLNIVTATLKHIQRIVNQNVQKSLRLPHDHQQAIRKACRQGKVRLATQR